MSAKTKTEPPVFLRKDGQDLNLSTIVRVVHLQDSAVVTFSDAHSCIFKSGAPETVALLNFIDKHRLTTEGA